MDNRLISGTLPQTVRALHIKPEGRFTNRPSGFTCDEPPQTSSSRRASSTLMIPAPTNVARRSARSDCDS